MLSEFLIIDGVRKQERVIPWPEPPVGSSELSQDSSGNQDDSSSQGDQNQSGDANDALTIT
uniref:Uncharacterized protein n=1 Tax=Candidatus Kentrum sp. UNK TaxID=2126344 RepID=A0A451ATP4_9GAMM|nr:MAG: hypothetical protein BECKUNK1418G_GA0071005_10427 [Candidatus Kentron sp. UNK]VFK69420.1 MAG: hypothetical protein BECKUNK1418H_GA0071006_101335 [Candidatus Kentron sp. UNK]